MRYTEVACSKLDEQHQEFDQTKLRRPRIELLPFDKIGTKIAQQRCPVLFSDTKFMPTIAKTPRILTVINVFIIDPANQQRLVNILLEAAEKVMNTVSGFISASVHRSTDGRRVITYSQWRSRDDFERMTQNPQMQAFRKVINQVADTDLHLYEVIETFEANRRPGVEHTILPLRDVRDQQH